MTNRFSKFALATTALLALGLGATGASAAPASADAVGRAKVMQQLTITKNSDLDFGTIVGGAAPALVSVNAAGTRTCATGLTCTGTALPAKFTIIGSKNETVSILIPTSVVLANGTGGSMVAVLDKVTSLDLGDTAKTGTVLSFGGTLAVGAGQADGVYTSPTFAVTVNYQ